MMAQGYLLTFFTQQNRQYDGKPLAEWILEQAKARGVRGATVVYGKEGFGHDGRFHSEGYFDLEDVPQLVTMALTAEECDSLLAHLDAAGVRVFYAKAEATFAFTSAPAPSERPA